MNEQLGPLLMKICMKDVSFIEEGAVPLLKTLCKHHIAFKKDGRD